MKFFKTFGFMLLTLSIIFIACNKDNSTGPEGFTSADMNRFVGNWAGHYEILENTTADTLKISLGSGDADFSVIIHATTVNPDTVNGYLKDQNTIDIPEQEMGGAPGTATIVINNETITFTQTGFGITGSGNDYKKY